MPKRLIPIGLVLLCVILTGALPLNNAFNKGKETEVVLVFDFPEEEPWRDYFPWSNGGEGEAGILWGYYEVQAKVTTTPSGHLKWNGRLVGWDKFRGDVTGEEWWMEEGSLKNHIFYHFGKDGSLLLVEPITCVYESQSTGQRVAVRWMFNVRVAPDGSEISKTRLVWWRYLK